MTQHGRNAMMRKGYWNSSFRSGHKVLDGHRQPMSGPLNIHSLCVFLWFSLIFAMEMLDSARVCRSSVSVDAVDF